MHDNLYVPAAIRLPPEPPATPKQENADGEENDRAQHVLGPIRDEHPEQDDKNGDPKAAEQGRHEKAPKQSLSAGATNQLRFTELGRLFGTILRRPLVHKHHLP
jgi:hypothetical protein